MKSKSGLFILVESGIPLIDCDIPQLGIFRIVHYFFNCINYIPTCSWNKQTIIYNYQPFDSLGYPGANISNLHLEFI